MLSRTLSKRASVGVHQTFGSHSQRCYSSLEGKVIAISGAGSGIGLATAKHLYPLGAKLSLTDIRKEALEAAIPEVTAGSSDSNIFTTVTDVRSSSQVDKWIEGTVENFGALDGAANLAGVVSKNIGKASVAETEDDDWHFVNNVNINGVFYALRAQLRAMQKLGNGGAIVNASSTAGIEGGPMNAGYSASKHAVIGLTRSAAKEVGRSNIRVNAIAPGVVGTPMVNTLGDHLADGLRKVVEERQCLGRKAQPVEIARLIAFLLSSDSSFITGAVYVADGGQTCSM